MRSALLWVVLFLVACDGGGTGMDAGSPDADSPDAGAARDARIVPNDVGPREDAGDLGGLWAVMEASHEVARMPASGAPAGDGESVLSAEVSPAVSTWHWEVREAEEGALVAESDDPSFTFTCPDERAAYDVFLTVGDGTSTVSYRERRLVTCTLPRVDAGRTVHNVDLAEASYFPNGSIDGTLVEPGDVIRVSGTFARSWVFLNLEGTSEEPIHIINEGVVTNTSETKALHLVNCRHVIVDGRGDDSADYGIVLRNTGDNAEQALYVRAYTEGTSTLSGSTDIEIFGVHVADTAGTGIQVDTHGYAEFNRENWQFDDLRVHHNYVEQAGLEGFYLGYTRDWVGSAETHLAYQLHNARVYRNTITNTGNDGLQICNANEALEIHDNFVRGVAQNDDLSHASSLQYNAGNNGWVYDNIFLGGAGANIQGGCTGGSSWFWGNVFERAEDFPASTSPSLIYIVAGNEPGTTFYFFDNTLIAHGAHGVSVNYGDGPGCNDGRERALDGIVSVNNVIVLPDGEVGTFARPAVAYRVDSPASLTPSVVQEPNVVVRESEIATLCFTDAAMGDHSIACETSAALTGDALSLSSLPSTMPSALPGGVFTDLTGRIFEDPANYGAHQLVAH